MDARFRIHKGMSHLVFENVRRVSEAAEPKLFLTLHPDFPCLPDAAEMYHDGGSPFILQVRLMGGTERLMGFQKRLALLTSGFERDAAVFRRIYAYYLIRNWAMFDDQVQKLAGKKTATQREIWQRHDLMQKMVEMLFAPLWVFTS